MAIRISSLIFLLYSFTCIAQEYTLKGVVNDENNAPVAFSNITLQSVSETTFIKGTTSDDHGFFKFEGLKADDYILKVSFLGFETYTDTVSLHGTINYKPIVLKEQTENLDNVTVIAKRPTVKRMVDRLVFNVENSTLSNGNVFDILKHTPGVLVFNDAISTSNGAPTIYINDRKVHLSSNEVVQLLEGTSANTIKSVEVIDSPPAKYEAEGGSVINIITSKNIIAGYNGSIFGTYKQGSEYPKYALGTNHFFKTDKIDAFLSYNISPRKDFRHNTESVNFIENNQVISSWETDFKRTRETATQNINANIDYELNAKNSIGFSSNILVSPREHTKTFVNSLTEVFDSNSVLDSMFNTSNRLVDETYNLAFTLDYIHKFKKAGETLSANAHHTNYDFSSYQNVDTGYFLPNETDAFRNNRFQTFSSQKIKLYTGQIDYVLPITDSESFETGGKLSSINSQSVLRQYIFENNQKIEDIQNSDTFLYDEMNYAGYTSYSKDWKTWSFKSGLRVEYTDITGNSLSTGQVNKSSYAKFFPSFHVLHTFNEHHELYFNYNKRIYRPRYSELNPFKYYLNDNAYVTGNPRLKPEIDDVFILGYTINKTYTFEAYYRYENNPTLEITFQDNDNNILKYINTNIDKNISYGLDFTTYTKLNSFWNIYVLSSLFYYEGQFYAQESNNELITNDKWSFYSQIINYFSFLKDRSLTAEVSYLYISPIVEGSSVYSSRHGLDINFRKTLWNNKASLSIGVSDLFNTQNFTQTNKYLNQDLFTNSRMENRLLTIGFNYKFGNTHLKTNQKPIELDERDRLNSKSN
ncbi:TonB-dependent receptor [Yeosuana aromativorans]|uniref:TonB-dependent receptor n=1 Tax=Yeosuana aromativorans TaxID=288019 RepID=A0A8J3BL90_9FLAO|nr:outer membrane beta-barrel family protein [Yeosuana aromativorans]GGK29203.1 TonB-dependent receptor [Yeosuana aromativorans]